MRGFQVLMLVLVAAAYAQADSNSYYKPLRLCGMRLAETVHQVCTTPELAADFYSKPDPINLPQECCERECDIRALLAFCERSHYGKK